MLDSTILADEGDVFKTERSRQDLMEEFYACTAAFKFFLSQQHPDICSLNGLSFLGWSTASSVFASNFFRLSLLLSYLSVPKTEEHLCTDENSPQVGRADSRL